MILDRRHNDNSSNYRLPFNTKRTHYKKNPIILTAATAPRMTLDPILSSVAILAVGFVGGAAATALRLPRIVGM